MRSDSELTVDEWTETCNIDIGVYCLLDARSTTCATNQDLMVINSLLFRNPLVCRGSYNDYKNALICAGLDVGKRCYENEFHVEVGKVGNQQPTVCDVQTNLL